ncbi:MAG: flagellar biosynthesis anti-sigma factor FlgM [Oceanicoccus sp.]
MVRDINGLGGYTGPKAVSEQGNKKTATAIEITPSKPETTANDDGVQLSSEAKTLQTLTDKVNSLPDVNLARAEQIKASLANGDYKVDDLVLADKILNSEALLGN